MRASFLMAILCAAAACSGDDDSGDSGGGDGGGTGDGGGDPDGNAGNPDAPVNPNEPPGLVGTTAAHNAVRAGVSTQPPLPPLTWDPALAAIAQAWVQQCNDTQQPIGLVDHNPGRSDTYPEYVGENIYGSGGQASGTAAVQLWASESANYNYANNSCNGVCGHYTQIVWRTTTKVGCAIHDCPGLTYGSTVVCNYAPGGNSGGRPY